MLGKRASGLLLHVTSLPGGYGIGDLGPGAYRFVEALVKAKQSYWQVLPVNPPLGDYWSPYRCESAYAGNRLLISPEGMYRAGLLRRGDLEGQVGGRADRVDFGRAAVVKGRLLARAWERFGGADAGRMGRERADYERFCEEEKDWVEDYGVFAALREHFGGRSWQQWPVALRDRRAAGLRSLSEGIRERAEQARFEQWVFYRQWWALKRYANERGVHIVGDVPIYVAKESAEVWLRPEVFQLDRAKRPTMVAGVPPDYFSKTGQLWGNPLYDWSALRKTGYGWWLGRLGHNFGMFDVVRVDHFRGFLGYWAVPARARTAAKGRWVEGPGEDFLRAALGRFGQLPIIVEDLGVITPDVREVILRHGLAGMKVLQFAFDGSGGRNVYCPHHHTREGVVYTGTHDNNTTRGWYAQELSGGQKRQLREYVGHRVAASEVHWDLIRLALGSVARLAVIPMQDVLGLGSSARMNRPAQAEGNWRWRMRPAQMRDKGWARLGRLTAVYDRE